MPPGLRQSSAERERKEGVSAFHSMVEWVRVTQRRRKYACEGGDEVGEAVWWKRGNTHGDITPTRLGGRTRRLVPREEGSREK